MIALELNEKLDAVELHLDRVGIENLIAQSESLKTIDTHIHLMTPAWGGQELTELTNGTNKLINHLIIYSHQV